jgi:tetratricopeptide (TPR) repeat protein
MPRRLVLLVVLFSAATEPSRAQDEGGTAAAGDGGGDDDIMAEIKAERARQEHEEEGRRQQEAARREQKRQEARDQRDREEMAKLGEVVVEVGMTVTVQEGSNHRNIPTAARLHAGDDPAAAAFRFCEKYNLLGGGKQQLLNIAQQLQERLNQQKSDYKPADGAVLKTAGAHSKRAKAAQKDGEYDQAVIDIIRAMSRKGLEEDVVAKFERSLSDALRGLRGQREQERKEAKVAAIAEKRKAAAEVAMKEAAARKEQDEADWKAFNAALVSAEGELGDVVAELGLTFTNADGALQVQARVHEGEDWHHGAFRLCASHAKGRGANVEQVMQVADMLKKHITGQSENTYEPPKNLLELDPVELIKRGKTARKHGRSQDAGADFSRAAMHESATEEQKVEGKQLVHSMLQLHAYMEDFETAVRDGQWESALNLAAQIPREERQNNARVALLEARCHQQLGRHSNAQRAAARVIESAAGYGSWKRGEPRMMAVNLGANAAMELGNSEKALKFYKTVLKYDPDQKAVRSQYKKLKFVVSLLEDAEKQLGKGYNHKAVDKLDEVLSSLQGMDVDSNVFRSTILLKLCRAKAAMKQHEEALEYCEQA